MKRFYLLGLSFVVGISCFSITPIYGEGKFDPFSSARRATQARTQDAIASLEFVDTPITTIFRMISDLTGWSIITSPEVSKQPPRINVWIKNLTPEEVLENVANLGQLVVERKGTTVKVMTFEEYTRIYGVEKHVVPLKHANAKAVADILKPFADKEDQARILPDETGNKIVLLVAKPLIDSLVGLVKSLDTPLQTDEVKIVPLKYQEAGVLASALEEFLTEQSKNLRTSSTGRNTKAVAQGVQMSHIGEGWIVTFMAEPKLNLILLRGRPQDVVKAAELIQELDTDPHVSIHSYELKYTNAHDVFNTIKDIVKEDEKTGRQGKSRLGSLVRLRISVSEQNNRIVVEGSAQDHKRLANLIEAIDKPLAPGSGGMRVYCLENTSAEVVAEVIRDIVEDQYGRGGEKLAKQQRTPTKQAAAPSLEGASQAVASSGSSNTSTLQLLIGDVLPPSISVAAEINAVVIRASAVEHEEFAKVIRTLDRPRKQVMLEVTLVTVRSDQTFDLGMDIGYGHTLENGVQQLGFTTFGIGNADPDTGAVNIVGPAFGLNYGLLNIRDFSFVLHALKTVGDVRITSSPKLLVEDNTQGTISQINQEPYESTSQGEETTVTSFGGFVEAGTTLNVIPHIAEDGWLRLQYSISLSSFGNRTAEQEASNLPPPRRETLTQGTVRIPAEHMIVLGGLVTKRNENNTDSIPFLSDIPILGELFKNRSRDGIHETLYIFVRPAILQDMKFRDLMYLSKKDIAEAKIEYSRYPSNPLKMLLPDGCQSIKKGEKQ